MANKLIVGNIKMNMKFDDIASYLEYFKNINSKNLVICPSYIYIPYFLKYNFDVGSQNVCAYSDGTYTGEVSASQLYSLGVRYTIVGHSERKIKLNESDFDINKKVISSINSKLNVILCIGETLEEMDILEKNKMLKNQIVNALINVNDLNNVIIAYEPVWCVGTNKLPNNMEIERTIKYIKQLVFDMYNQNIRVIYGGSINEKNILKLNDIDVLDGFLIGSVSVDPSKFIQIINEVM